MSNLYDKIEWAILAFNAAVAQKVDRYGNKYDTEEDAIKANLYYLYHIKRVSPGGQFPNWARLLLKVPPEKIEKAGFSFTQSAPREQRPTINSDALIKFIESSFRTKEIRMWAKG
jgi:hypothetical protein